MKNIELKDLRYYIIPGEGVPKEHWGLYSEAYRMWRAVWSKTFQELDGADSITSDNFTRQDWIGAIFHFDRCVAMSVHHDANFNLPAAAEDSYFEAWTPEALSQLTRDGKNVLICSHLTVDPEYRGEIADALTLKNLTMALSVRLLLQSDYDVMTGTMRNNRGAQRTAYATGATPIMANAQMHGVDVDLVGWYRNEVLVNPNMNDHIWTESLWNTHVEVSLQRPSTQSNKQKAS